jgi:hypothetical protein
VVPQLADQSLDELRERLDVLDAWALAQELGVEGVDELRAQLNTWLNVQGLQKKTSWRDSNWDADWEQLAHSVRRPSALAQRTVVWYIAHGLGDA